MKQMLTVTISSYTSKYHVVHSQFTKLLPWGTLIYSLGPCPTSVLRGLSCVG